MSAALVAWFPFPSRNWTVKSFAFFEIGAFAICRYGLSEPGTVLQPVRQRRPAFEPPGREPWSPVCARSEVCLHARHGRLVRRPACDCYGLPDESA